jgi:hypothetical protein
MLRQRRSSWNLNGTQFIKYNHDLPFLAARERQGRVPL